jgi:hypothetical protein
MDKIDYPSHTGAGRGRKNQTPVEASAEGIWRGGGLATLGRQSPGGGAADASKTMPHGDLFSTRAL